MSRIPEENRLANELFSVMLKRKLRIPLYPGTGDLACPYCKKPFDRFGDHLFRCKPCVKTTMSDDWCKGVETILERVLPLVKLVKSPNEVESQKKKLVRSLRNTRTAPFDVSFKINHYIGESHFKSPLKRVGLDVIITHASDSQSSPPQTAQPNHIQLQLQEGEKAKYHRQKGGTNPVTKETLSGDQIVGELLDDGMSLVPMAVSPYGLFGGASQRFWYGTEKHYYPPPKLSKPNAIRAANIATSLKVPYNILQRANDVWRFKRPGEFFGGSYKAMDPKTYVNQQFGRLVCVANGSHIIRAMETLGDPVPVDDTTISPEENAPNDQCDSVNASNNSMHPEESTIETSDTTSRRFKSYMPLD